MGNRESERKRRGRGIFDIINDLFEELWEEMENFERDFMRMIPKEELGEGEVIRKPIVYGFRLDIGPDGVPRIYEFGNVRRGGRMGPRITVSEEREPLVDIYEEADKVRIVAELPGVDENKIKVEAIDDKRILIEASNHDRKYRKEIELPTEVNIDSAEAVYKNGVLEIKIKKKGKEEKKGKIIQIKKE